MRMRSCRTATRAGVKSTRALFINRQVRAVKGML